MLNLSPEELHEAYIELYEEFEQYKKESIKWGAEDFLEYEGYSITPEDAQNALEHMIQDHDCQYGINWSTVEYFLSQYGKKVEPDESEEF